MDKVAKKSLNKVMVHGPILGKEFAKKNRNRP